MLEEKRTRTMEAVLVSPATPGQYVIAKALTGLCYTVLALVLVFVAFNALIVQWWLAIAAAAAGALCVVALGLLLGMVLGTRQQFALVTWIVSIPAMLPIFLSALDDLLPAWLNLALRWIPTVALYNVLRVSFTPQTGIELWVPQLALVVACAGLLLGWVAYLVRRTDR